MTEESAAPVGIRLRKYAQLARSTRGWNQAELAHRLTVAGHPIKAFNLRNREARTSPVGIDEAIALATVLGLPGVEALIEAATSGCAHCHGIPPVGFTCNACGAA